MRKGQKAIGWMLIPAAAIGVGLAIYHASTWLLASLAALSPEVVAGLVGAIGTAAASVGAVVWNQQSLKRREIDQAQRPKKTEAYKNFLHDIVIGLLQRTRDEEPEELLEDEDLRETFFDFTGDVIAWASSDFIASYQQFREAGQDGDLEVLLYLDDMLRAMRRDLGHRDWTLDRGALIKLFLVDPEKVDQLVEA